MRLWSTRHPILRLTPILVPLLAACGPRPGPADLSALTDTLKSRIEAAYDFSRPGAVERMAALYPDSGQVVSASGGMIVARPDSLRAGIEQFWNNVGKNMQGPRWKWGEVYVERLGPDGAALTATWSIPHRTPEGHPHVIRGAWTAVFRRIDGKWLIVMEHLSTPAG